MRMGTEAMMHMITCFNVVFWGSIGRLKALEWVKEIYNSIFANVEA
jgi:hypothetical protein